MTTNDDNFDYGALGRDWWLDAVTTGVTVVLMAFVYLVLAQYSAG